MTGLDIVKDKLIEIAVVVTDSELNVLDPGLDLIISADDADLDGMNEVVVEMHRKYADKGLQVISLSLDDTSDPKAVEEARKFLLEKKATFLNVLLDEEFGVGFEKLEINAIPAVCDAPPGVLSLRDIRPFPSRNEGSAA